MKQYTKQITVQAVQWTGSNYQEVYDFLTNNSISQSDWELRGMDIRFDVYRNYLTVPVGYFLVFIAFGGTDFIEGVSPEDFTRDYKEVSE